MWKCFGGMFLGSALLLGGGCATQVSGPELMSADALYRERTGQVTESDLFIRLPRALARHGYLLEQGRAYGRDLYFETQWKDRKAFPDEIDAGYEAARTQVRFNARWDGRLYVLRIEVDNRYLTPDGEWVHSRATEMFDAYAREIASEVRLEVASGMRRY